MHSPTRSRKHTSEASGLRTEMNLKMTMGTVLIVIFFVNADIYCEKIFTILLNFDHINGGKLVLQFDK